MEFIKKIKVILIVLTINVLFYAVMFMYPSLNGTVDGLVALHIFAVTIIFYSCESEDIEAFEYGLMLGHWVQKGKRTSFVWVFYLSVLHMVFWYFWGDKIIEHFPLDYSFMSIEMPDFGLYLLIMFSLLVLPIRGFFEIMFFLIKLIFGKNKKVKTSDGFRLLVFFIGFFARFLIRESYI